MKYQTSLLSICITLAAPATCSAAAIEPSINGTDATASATTRRLQYGGLYRMKGVDLVGKDVSNFNGAAIFGDCFITCLSTPSNEGSVTAVTRTSYNGGTCWCKATGSDFTPVAPNADADSLFLLGNSDKPVHWSGTREGVDMVGYDLSNTRKGTMKECQAVCASNPECWAVTWTNHEGGTCWLKRRASALVAKAGAQSAFLSRLATSLADR